MPILPRMTMAVGEGFSEAVPRLAALRQGKIAPEDALEPALRVLLEASGAAAGAICLFDARDGLLRLAVEIGLSDEGCRQLRTVRPDGGGWTVPLEGLSDGLPRVTRRNKGKMPALVDPPEALAAVACLPLYANGTPRGSVVLAGGDAWVPSEKRLRAFKPAIDELTRIVEGIGRSATSAEPAAERAFGVTKRSVRDVLQLLRPLRWRLGQPRNEGAPLSGEVYQAEIDRLLARLAEAEDALAQEERRRLEQERVHAEDRARGTADRDETLRRALELTASAETLRAEASAEAEAIRATLAEAQRRELEREDEASRIRMEAEELSARARTALAERERLGAALEAARLRDAEAVAQRARLEAELAALREGAATLATEQNADRVAREDASSRARARIAELERERERLTAEREDAIAAERRARTELDALATRSAGDRDQTLRHALDIAGRAEEGRAAAVSELEAVRAALAEAQSLLLHAEERSGSDSEAMLRYAAEADRKTEEARAAAVAELEAVRGALGEAQAAVLSAEDEAQHARRLAADHEASVLERRRLASELADARARMAEAEARVAALGEAVRTANAESVRVEAAARGHAAEMERRWSARVDALEGAAAESRAALERELVERAAALDAARAGEEEARALLAAAERAAAERDATLRRAQALAHETEEARTGAVTEMEAIRAALADAQAFVLRVEDDARRARAEVERLGAAQQPPERPTAPRRPSGQRMIAVIDLDEAFAAAAGASTQVEVLAPDAQLAGRLTTLEPTRILVNLAAPGALEALAELRAAGCRARFWGVLAAPGTASVISLGMIEPARRPLDAEALLGLLASYATRGTRVLAVGAEADAFISLRQALTRQAMSLSIAWDEKQAIDLLPMVRPEVVVVDLGVPPRGGYGVVADLAGAEQLPTAILIPRLGEDPAAAFAAVATERARQVLALSRERVVQAVCLRAEDRPTAPASRK